jgi:hypothetical protein
MEGLIVVHMTTLQRFDEVALQVRVILPSAPGCGQNTRFTFSIAAIHKPDNDG